ncbi:MAG: glutamine--tRNA ligase/YqeY domain fusion protein [Oscillospiraceae bacterium]|jgi:glutaminyl-tRNA synthetase|nr:glutamine--tRNA ligase/YqeY domain fusion protein [Oscillospiraceae bacterium]
MENAKNFIELQIDEDLAIGGRYEGQTVHTRFPPEPNAYLTIGNAYAINISFGIATRYGGLANLRMDDTNPAKEEAEFVDAIVEDMRWLGWDWGDRMYYGSDYFEQTYEFATELIRKGLAYVCELTPEEFRANAGTVGVPAISPWRDRATDESLDLFKRMRNAEFPEGKYTLRAKIDLASGNFNLRDPVLFRIRYVEHHRLGTTWCIFPMYDFAHPIQDALEGITHSLCSDEFKDHRPFYDWVIENCSVPAKPRQIEFGRRSLTHTVVSKRYMRRLLEAGAVTGYDDPRLPTLRGLRRRGYTPAAIADFCSRIGVGVSRNTVDYALLEHCLREDLSSTAPRVMAVLRPIKLTITNYPDGQSESFSIENSANPEDKRDVRFSRSLWIERDDFEIEPPKKYNRLYVGNEVRLKGAYIVKCTGFELDGDGNVTEVLAEYDPATAGGNTPDGRRVRGTIHWVNQDDCIEAEVRLYDDLFTDPNPGSGDVDFMTQLNPNSLEILRGCKLEPTLANASGAYQFLRLGYFVIDEKDSSNGALVFNRSVTLKEGYRGQPSR